MKDSAHESNRRSTVARFCLITAFASLISVTLAQGQARGFGHAGMGARAGPRMGARAGFTPHSGFGMGGNTPLTGFCDRSPFCVTGAAAVSFGQVFSPFYTGGWGYDGGWGYPGSYGGAEYDNFQQQIAQYIGNLGQEVQKLREDAERTRYAAPPKPPAEPKIINVSFAGTVPSESVPAAVFVLKNGQKIEATRYVLTADTLSVQRLGESGQTIPVRELNVAATTTANRERGLPFKFPTNRGEVFLGF
jgi:hypothetical protein